MEVADLSAILVLLHPYHPEGGFSSSVPEHNLLGYAVTHPAVFTVDEGGPVEVAPLPTGSNWYFYCSFPGDNHQNIFVVIEGGWSEAYGDGDSHSWRDVSAVLFGVLDGCKCKLLLLQRGDFDALGMF